MITFYAYHGEYFGYKFLMAVDEDLSIPRWTSSEPFPPLAPRAAISAARVMVRRLLASEVGSFEPRFSACSLKRRGETDDWYYLVAWFVPDLEPDVDWSEFSVPVLFDGSTPEPLKFRYEDRHSIYKHRD